MGERDRVTAEDYARAERFLPGNLGRAVRNHTLRHRWLGDDHLGYLRDAGNGDTELVIVDAATGSRDVSADPAAIAAWLEAENPARPGELLSPDGAWAGFVRDHDVWVRRTSDDAEFALTTDGEQHHAYGVLPGSSDRAITHRRAGAPPWPQLVWSPDSRSIATHRVDERLVADLHLLQSVPEDGSYRPRLWTYRFAMPGDEHMPTSEYVVLDVASRGITRMDAPPALAVGYSPPIEVGGVWWSSDSATLYWIERDRFARSATLHRGDRATGATAVLAEETGERAVFLRSGWLNDTPDLHVLPGGDLIRYSDRSGWGHLWLLDGATGAARYPLTSGEWTVRGLVHVDEDAGRVYFLASGREPGDVYATFLYRVDLDGGDLRLLTPEPAHHTPAVTSVRPIRAGTRPPGRLRPESGAVSPSGRYLIDTYSRPDLPPVHVLRTVDGELVTELERADASRLGPRTPVERFELLAADGVTPIHGNLFRPADYDPSRRYPVIEANYPGPQSVRSASGFVETLFESESPQALAELGFVVVTIDGRGTPHRSRAFLDHSAGRLDLASDIDDHVAALRQLAEQDPSIDLSPGVGIYGHSGGGFRAAHAILARPDVYSVAVAAEGNHDQRPNVATWGENHHGPLEGPPDDAHYDLASTIPLAANLRGRLLLMHGDMDDNVHPALTLRLVDALVKENRDFDLLILPNENHNTAYTSPYFIRRTWDYFVRHLGGAEPPAGYRISSAG